MFLFFTIKAISYVYYFINPALKQKRVFLHLSEIMFFSHTIKMRKAA